MKLVYLIGSCIQFSNDYVVKWSSQRSYFNEEQRLAQTIESVHNIKSNDPDSVIYLIDASEKEFPELVELQSQVIGLRYVQLHKLNPTLSTTVRTHRSKSHGECLIFLEFLRHHKEELREFDYIVKLSGRYQINKETFTKECLDPDNDKFYFIGPWYWQWEEWKHIADYTPKDMVYEGNNKISVLTMLYVTGQNLLDQLEIILAAAASFTDWTQKMHYIDIEFVFYYLIKKLNLSDRIKLLPWQVDGFCGATGVFRYIKLDKFQSESKYPVQMFGYMPAYMGNPKYKLTKKFPKRVAVSFDNLNTDMSADYRVLVQCEPPHIWDAFPQMIRENHQNYDLVLTYNESLFDLPNHKVFIPVGCFIDNLPLNKTNQISYIMSSKIMTNEHRMRFMILRRLEESKSIGDFEFIMHRNPPEIDSKNRFFINAKFHITCENAVMNNMFSEKLIDCFRSRTVPIYYGCLNIEKYFDERGIIRFNTIEEFDKICQEITPEWYDERLSYIEENYQRAREYWEKSVFERVEEIIEKELRQKFPEYVNKDQL
jgi:hypothetical protein